MFPVIATAGAAYVLYNVYYNKVNDDNRAAETILPKIEEKTAGSIQNSVSRPTTLPGHSYIASTLGGTAYYPVADRSVGDMEKEIKVLNVANRFLYG